MGGGPGRNRGVVPANPMNLGYANEACITNAICLGRKLALCEAGAVSNTGGPPAGAPKTQQGGTFLHWKNKKFRAFSNSKIFKNVKKSMKIL